jgi:hypothetical protein
MIFTRTDLHGDDEFAAINELEVKLHSEHTCVPFESAHKKKISTQCNYNVNITKKTKFYSAQCIQSLDTSLDFAVRLQHRFDCHVCLVNLLLGRKRNLHEARKSIDDAECDWD